MQNSRHTTSNTCPLKGQHVKSATTRTTTKNSNPPNRLKKTFTNTYKSSTMKTIYNREKNTKFSIKNLLAKTPYFIDLHRLIHHDVWKTTTDSIRSHHPIGPCNHWRGEKKLHSHDYVRHGPVTLFAALDYL